MTRIELVRDEDILPDPYLLLATIKQHLADHQPMSWGDELAWAICDELQKGVADYD
jgi:hypothetical protein